MRNSKILLATLLGAAFMFSVAGGALAHDQQGQNMMKEQNQATQKMPAADSGMMMQHGMHKKMMGHGKMMDDGMMMGQGMKMRGGGFPKLMSADDAKALISHWLARHIGERVKVGAIEELGIFAFGVEVVTVDGSLVQRLAVDRRGHGIWRID